jgi:molybdopterin-guanine dinucleotide biosynthesis protein A
MGSPKALLDWNGRPLWRHQADTLQELEPDERFISLPAGLALDAAPWQPVADRVPDLGPLGGIEAALRLMRSDWLVVLAIDLPAMTADYLRTRLNEAIASLGFESAHPLGSGASSETASARGAVAVDDGLYLGLSGVYPRAILPLVESALASGDRSVQQLARRAGAAGLLTAHPISPGERALFRNVNRPGD